MRAIIFLFFFGTIFGLRNAVSQSIGVVSVPSSLSFSATVKAVKSRIEKKGLNLFCVIDHRDNARGASLDLQPTVVIIFGNPKVGTLMMQEKEMFAIDLPQKLLVTDRNGKVQISYNDPEYISKRHRLSNRQRKIIEKIKNLLRSISTL